VLNARPGVGGLVTTRASWVATSQAWRGSSEEDEKVASVIMTDGGPHLLPSAPVRIPVQVPERWEIRADPCQSKEPKGLFGAVRLDASSQWSPDSDRFVQLKWIFKATKMRRKRVGKQRTPLKTTWNSAPRRQFRWDFENTTHWKPGLQSASQRDGRFSVVTSWVLCGLILTKASGRSQAVVRGRDRLRRSYRSRGMKARLGSATQWRDSQRRATRRPNRLTFPLCRRLHRYQSRSDYAQEGKK